MSLDNLQVVDVLGRDTVTGEVVLTILDSWDWLDETEHLLALQTKLNNYFDFVENGQIFESNPDWHGMKCRIDILLRFVPSSTAVEFLQIATRYCKSMQVPLTYRVDGKTSEEQKGDATHKEEERRHSDGADHSDGATHFRMAPPTY